ncbi:hypothetical protein ABB30_04895 [Stenotrophomonas ginsengisoli]|uniref:Autotransporter domain-containing protein n=1 Tax=Stenotrophomonas ginsengisoli TaxID=336566 RepID=A0A0R0DIU5_9GAMM|nr:hypothetical protein ABB30_04895 [Stenotrophomonas ginsengisoli]
MGAAQAAGFTGAGVQVAILDTASAADYAPLAGRISTYQDFTAKPADTSAASKSGHGALMAALIGGQSTSQFNGGAAPDAQLHLGRVCAEDACSSDAITKGVAHYIASNVRLFNLSLGTAGSMTSAQAYSAMAEYIVSGDALLVAATGNAGRAQPDNPAALPAYLPQYRNNWLAVANVRINSTGQAAGLHALSNACGDAANFCLVAPGSHQVQPVPGTAFADSQYVDGTSASTAVVTGAAAQVWQAFPWMSASNLQQTLLTTATDLGDPGVDATYGWGMLNTGKAVQGPAQFTQDFVAELRDGQTGVFANAISGTGGLVKRGNGQLSLLADNTYQGLTRVEGGSLVLGGDLAGSLLLAKQGQLLAAGGQIGGNFTAESTATTSISLGNPLTVAGQAQLAGKLHLRPEAATYSVGSNETLLQAGSIAGTFDSVSYANDLFWEASLNYEAQRVVAQMQRTSATVSSLSLAAPAAVVNGAGMADTLIDGLERNNLPPTGNSPGAAVVSATSSLMLADNQLAATSLATLSAPLLGMEHRVSLDQDLYQLGLLADRNAVDGLDQPALWMDGVYQAGDLNQPGYGTGHWHLDGFKAGIRAPIGDTSHSWGLGLSMLEMDMRAPGSDRSQAKYGRANLWWQGRWPQWQLSAVAGLGRNRVDNARQIIAGDNQEDLHSRRRDRSSQLRVDARWTAHAWLHPYLAAGLVQHRQGAFDERSGLGLGLRADAQRRDLPFAETGLRASRDAGRWQWSGTLAYQRLLGGRDLGYHAAFDGADAIAVDVAGLGMAAERWRLHLQGRWQVNEHLHVQAGAHGQWLSGNQYNHGLDLGLEWRF